MVFGVLFGAFRAFCFQSALMVLSLDSKLKASELGLVTEGEAWGRVVGRKMAGFMMYS